MASEKRFLKEPNVQAQRLRLLQVRENLHAEPQKGFDQLALGKRIPVEDAYRSVAERIREIENVIG